VDANVLLDVATGDPEWGEWSASALAPMQPVPTWICSPATAPTSYFPTVTVLAPATGSADR
jgi:hypothetical protein